MSPNGLPNFQSEDAAALGHMLRVGQDTHTIAVIAAHLRTQSEGGLSLQNCLIEAHKLVSGAEHLALGGDPVKLPEVLR